MPVSQGSTGVGGRPATAGWSWACWQRGLGLQGRGLQRTRPDLGELAVAAAEGSSGSSGTLRQPEARRPGSHLQKLGTSCPWVQRCRGPGDTAHPLVQVLSVLSACRLGTRVTCC